jgi:hypothetical protein
VILAGFHLTARRSNDIDSFGDQELNIAYLLVDATSDMENK